MTAAFLLQAHLELAEILTLTSLQGMSHYLYVSLIGKILRVQKGLIMPHLASVLMYYLFAAVKILM